MTMTALSEVFPLTIAKPNLMGFRLTPGVDREVGNRLSFHFSRQFPNVVVVWSENSFWVMGALNTELPNQQQWREALENIQKAVDEFQHYYWSFQWIPHPQEKPAIIAQLAYQILRVHRPFQLVSLPQDNKVKVKREVDFWPETIESQEKTQPALTFTIRSRLVFQGTLADFFESHPYRQEPEKLLVGLKVQDIDSGSIATIVGLAGTVGEHRQELEEKATGATSKEALRNAPDNQPLVAIKFGRKKQPYPYAMAALRPVVTAETASRLGVDYGRLLKTTKITHQGRQKLLSDYKEQAATFLIGYGFELRKCINSYQQPVFFMPNKPVNETVLLFGKGVTHIQSDITKGLKEGGVYKHHRDFASQTSNALPEIGIAALKLCDRKVGPFLTELQKRLEIYKFQSEVIEKKAFPVKNTGDAETRVELEKIVNELVEVEPDIVLVFLPERDRNADNEQGGSLYHQIYSQLLRRRIASQFIYDDTLNKQSRYVLNQVVPGILAKLGNLPFVLAEPLNTADYFIGLDISRSVKEKLPGTRSACASIRLYGQRGEFVNYQLESDLIEGEEIPLRFLEALLPQNKLGGQTVLVYRDGRFCGREVENFLARAKAIHAQLILVECRKSGIPRLYELNQRKITAPKKGLAMRMSPSEAILVTTEVPANVGLARPLRLTIRPEGKQVPIEEVVDTTLKLTLLHHGALKTPRLPMPLYGSDRMAYLRLKGIYPSILEGDRQFWL